MIDLLYRETDSRESGSGIAILTEHMATIR